MIVATLIGLWATLVGVFAVVMFRIGEKPLAIINALRSLTLWSLVVLAWRYAP